MLKKAAILSSVLLLMLMPAGCRTKKPVGRGDTGTYADFVGVGARIAAQAGDMYGAVAKDVFGAGETPEFTTMADMLEAVRLDRVDAALADSTYIRRLNGEGGYRDLDYLWVPRDVFENRSAPIFHTETLRDSYNGWFDGIVADGTFEQIRNRWMGGSLPAPADVPKFNLREGRGTLRVCETGNFPPMSYYGPDGEPTGFDIEIVSRFALHMGLKLDVTMMAYDAIVPYVLSGKADMSAATLTITPEREKSLRFGRPSVVSQAVLVAKSATPPPSVGSERGHADFMGKHIGVSTGAISDQITERNFRGTPHYYSDLASGIEDVRLGRIDGFMTNYSTLRLVAAARGNEDLECIKVPLEFFNAHVGAVSQDRALLGRFNAMLSELWADGELSKMQGRWLTGVPDLDSKTPDVRPAGKTAKNGALNIATCADRPPFSYMGAKGEIRGYSVELARRFAEREGKEARFAEMEFGALIPYVLSGKAELGIANISITEERKKSIAFSDPICEDQLGILALADRGRTQAEPGRPKAGAAGTAAQSPGQFLTHTDLAGQRIGVVTGTICDAVAKDRLNAKPVYYSADAAAIEDVRKGRLEGTMTDLSAAAVIAGTPGNEDLRCVDIPGEFFMAPMGAMSMEPGIIKRFNAFLAKAKADGTVADMRARWLDSAPGPDTRMPDIPLKGGGGTLKVATCATAVPFAFIGANGELMGYSVELARRFAAHEGMGIAFVDMDFSGLIPYTVSRKADLAIANVSITEERKKSVLFTDSIHDDRLGVLVMKRKQGGPGAGGKADAKTAKAAKGKTAQTHRPLLTHADLAGKRIGVITGSVCDVVASEHLRAKPVYYSAEAAGIEDVRKGRLEGVMLDLSAAVVVAGTAGNEDLRCVDIPAEYFVSPMGAISKDPRMIKRLNTFLAKAKADGTLLEMQERWLKKAPNPRTPMPDIPLKGGGGTLKVATFASSMPFAFVGANGELKGYSIELARRFAAHEGMGIAFVDMDFAGLIPYTAAGKADFAIANICDTEERRRSILFSDSIYDDRMGVLVMKQGGTKRGHADFAGQTMGVITGTLCYLTAEKIGCTPTYYTDSSAVAEDVRKGRVAGYVSALSTVRAMAAQPGKEDFEAIPIPPEHFSAGIAGISNDVAVIADFNKFLSSIETDGTLAEMQGRWLGEGLDLDAPMPPIPGEGKEMPNGILKVATCSDSLPYAFPGAGGALTGFSVELARRFGARLGKSVEFTDVEFGGMIPFILSGKADIGLANMAITDERKKSVMFTDPFFDEQHGILALRETGGSGRGSFLGWHAASDWLKAGIERNLVTDARWKMILSGLGITMTISLAAQALGTVLGCLVCFLLLRKNRAVRGAAGLYCGLIRGTPVVVLLMITYYIIFGSTNVPGVLVAIAAFAMVEAAGVAHNLKGAIETVDPVEIEAARSLGFSPFGAFRSVTLPQAVRRALPGYTKGFVELVKATAIVGYIAIQDLTRAGDIIRSRTYDAYFPLLFVALVYLSVTTLCVKLFSMAVEKVNRGMSK